MKPPPESTSLSERTYRLAFTGSAEEYVRIWIINVFLTVITLGIYHAWAKVRTRRYFYAHTTLDGYAFDYLANPIAILKGNLRIAAGLILCFLSQAFAPELSGPMVLGCYAVMPYLIYKSLRFRVHNSAYRNIRMHFHGSAAESYRIYFWWSMLIPLTLGLILPYLVYRKKKYVLDHVAYGTTRIRFNGAPRAFYAMYLVVSGLSILVMAIAVVLFGMLAGKLGGSIDNSPVTLIIWVPAGYLVLIMMASVIQQCLDTHSSNYGWNSSTLGHIRFHSSLKMWPLVGIQITNLLAMMCSLGLLIPWARIRRTRYILDHLQLIVSGDLDHFTADQGAEDHALDDVSLVPPLGTTRRVLELPGGARCETTDFDAVRQLEVEVLRGYPHQRGMQLVHRLESHWCSVMACAACLLIGLWGLTAHGIPWMAKRAAFATPQRLIDTLSTQSLAFLDGQLFQPSRLDSARLDSLHHQFHDLIRDRGSSMKARLVFRSAPTLGANALALPSGLVIMTDQLVYLARDDRELLGILAHELAHVEQRHGLRNLYQSTGIFLLISMLLGDLTSMTATASSLPTFLLESGYSRQFETDADTFAGQYMLQRGWGTKPLRDILQRISGTAGDELPALLSTHPGTAERLQHLEAMEQDTGGR